MFSGNRASYLVSYNSQTQTFTVVDQRGGSPDGTDTVNGVENFQFADGIVASTALATPNHAPVLTATSANVAASAGQVLQLSSLFNATDADNDALTYYFHDGGVAANSGHFVVNGSVIPNNTTIALTAAQLAQTTFVAGALGTSDNISMQLSDGQTVSNPGAFTVNVASPASPAWVIGGDNFSFAPDLGEKGAVDFSRGGADGYDARIDLPAAGVVAPTDAKSDFDLHFDAGVDPLTLFGMHTADHTHFVI